MKSKQRHEGYLLIDNRFAPGPDQSAMPGRELLGGAGVTEAATITCSHCQYVLIRNPTRTRERGYCRKCDHYICDLCNLVMSKTLECVTYKRRMDEAQERAFLNEQRGSPSLIVV